MSSKSFKIIGSLLIVLASSLASRPVLALDLLIEGLLPNMAVVNVDGKRVTLFKGKTTHGLTLISADSYEAVIEYQGKRYTYGAGGQPVRTDFPETADTVDVLTIWPDASGLYTTLGSINDVRSNFMVDTGASVVAMNVNHAASFGIDAEKDGTPMNVQTASGNTMGHRILLKSVRVGSIVVYDVEAVVLPGDFPRHILLGMSFLKNVDMQRQEQAILLKAKTY